MKNHLTDLKIYLVNGATLSATFANIDISLKIILVLVTLGYTSHKWYLLHKNNKNKKQ